MCLKSLASGPFHLNQKSFPVSALHRIFLTSPQNMFYYSCRGSEVWAIFLGFQKLFLIQLVGKNLKANKNCVIPRVLLIESWDYWVLELLSCLCLACSMPLLHLAYLTSTFLDPNSMGGSLINFCLSLGPSWTFRGNMKT